MLFTMFSNGYLDYAYALAGSMLVDSPSLRNEENDTLNGFLETKFMSRDLKIELLYLIVL